jgi:hypothetical protein
LKYVKKEAAGDDCPVEPRDGSLSEEIGIETGGFGAEQGGHWPGTGGGQITQFLH